MIKSENRANKKIYTVVEVFRGIAEATYSFGHLKDAQRHLKQFRKERNLDEDDAQIFENEIVNQIR